MKSGCGAGLDVLVQVHLIVPEDEVVRREGLPIRPPHPLAEEDGADPPVVGQPPVLGHAGHDLGPGVVPEEDLVRGDDPVPVLRVGRPREGPPPGPAVLPGGLQRLDHHRLLGDALLDRGELAGLHQLGQHGGLAELLGPLGGIQDQAGTLQLADEAGAELLLPRKRHGGSESGEGRGSGGQRCLLEELPTGHACALSRHGTILPVWGRNRACGPRSGQPPTSPTRNSLEGNTTGRRPDEPGAETNRYGVYSRRARTVNGKPAVV